MNSEIQEGDSSFRPEYCAIKTAINVENMISSDLKAARQQYLETGNESLLPIVDAHHHFWDIVKNPHPWLQKKPMIPFRYGDYSAICKNFLPTDYAKNCQQHRVMRHVTMEGEWDANDPVGEALWMKALAEECDKPHAMAAQIWLDREDIDDVLHAYNSAPLKGFVRSVRHKPSHIAYDEYTQDWSAPGSMRDLSWRAGYARLGEAGLMFELQAPWWHMDEAVELAHDFPDTRIIINHAGLPATRETDVLAKWRSAMTRIAACPNVYMKISGLGVRGETWTPAQQRPVVHALIEDFGIRRCLFASNHPVDAVLVTLDDLWGGFKTLTQHLEPQERLALFCDNAVALYELR